MLNHKHSHFMKKVLRALPIVLVLAFASSLVAAQDSSGNTGDATQGRTLSVVGIGSASGTPDIAFIQVGIEVQNENVGTAVDEVNQRMNEVITALKDAGIPETDIRTTNFSVNQQQQPRPAGQTASDTAQDIYAVSNIAQVRVANIDDISNIIQLALDSGANRMYGLNFGIEDSAALISQARQNAVANARARAEELASEFGVTLGEPITINEYDSGGNPVALESASMGGAAPAPIISQGQQSVSIRLEVTFEITSAAD
ncbi:MAG: hypothetical protein CL607_21930 [Anaerolineaceae bacterium]|nr:hypothetical protein [Anaerolineaceae bacterium]